MDKSFPLINNQTIKKEINLFNTTIYSLSKTIIAGPCTVESYDQLSIIAKCLVENNLKIIRGGSFKPRSSPYSFDGLGSEALQMLSMVKKEFNLATISEILSEDHLNLYDDVDILQIGARNMQNISLLKAVASTNKPIFLKRGFGNTLKEWLFSAEYLAKFGANQIILCERGSRTFENETRFSLDLGVAILAKKYSNLLVFADPSHACGRNDIVENLALASLACGLDGVMLEIHNNPENATCDGDQALNLNQFNSFMQKVK